MSKFVKGTIILLAAGMMTRILGFINRVVHRQIHRGGRGRAVHDDLSGLHFWR